MLVDPALQRASFTFQKQFPETALVITKGLLLSFHNALDDMKNKEATLVQGNFMMSKSKTIK